jgi:hypothetical protein
MRILWNLPLFLADFEIANGIAVGLTCRHTTETDNIPDLPDFTIVALTLAWVDPSRPVALRR